MTANSIERAIEQGKRCCQQPKVTILLLFQASRALPVDAIPSANKHIKYYEND
jgi:hypothetical protein